MKAIYKITNIINGKIYIGQSVDPNKRFISHISRAKNGSSQLIHQAMREYGIENFILEVIEWTDFPDEKEQYYIEQFNSMNPNGYNGIEGGVQTLPRLYGEDHPNSVWNNNIVEYVKFLLRTTNMSQKEIGEHILPHMDQSVVTAINLGKIHYDSNEDYPIRKETPYHLKEKDVDDVKYLLQNSDATVYQIADFYNVSPSTIKHINSGRNYHDDNLNYPLKVRKYGGSKNSQPVETILAKRSTLTIDT